MSPRTPRGRAVLLLLVCAVTFASWLVTVFEPGYQPHLETVADELALAGLTYPPLVLVAALLVWRVPHHGVTRVLAVMAACSALSWVSLLLLDGREASRPGWDFAWVLGGVAWLGTLPMLPMLFLLFPDGAPPSPRWRSVLHLQCAALVVLLGVAVADADPGAGLPRVLAVCAAVTLVTSLVLAVAGLVYRWRRSSGEQRAQLRLFMVAAAAAVSWYVTTGALLALGQGVDSSWVGSFAVSVVFISPILAMTYAVVRHHLYGIDPVVNRLVVWGLVTVVLLGGYLGAVGVLVSATGAARGSPVLAALAAVAVAVCLSPVRSWVQRVVDRAMYGLRDDPLQMLRAAGASLASAVDPTEVGLCLTRSATTALRLPWAALDLQSEGAWTRIAVTGTARGAEPAVTPVRDAGEDVGRLLVEPRRGERDLPRQDRRLLEDLAVQAGPAVRAARLVTELTESRDRLVQARESERHRLRRDLHDSLSPALAGIGLSAETASRSLPDRPDVTDGLLRRIADEARGSAEVVRRMLADLRPPALEHAGLVAALEDRAAQLLRPGEFDLRVHAADRLDDIGAGVQVAAYRIAVEAMTNAVRHSGGTACDVVLESTGGQLRLQVSDDGHGLSADHRPGVGLTSLVERAEEVGGHVDWDGAGTGTGLTLVCVLPVSGGAR